jgi:hypothetical protein
LSAINFDKCAHYITIILLSFIIISSWVFSISGQSRLAAAAAAAASPSLSTKTNLSNTITESAQQKNVAVSGKNVYVVWYDFSTSPGNSHIFFTKSTDGGSTFLGTPKDLSTNPANLGDSFNPRIAVSGSNVYVVWYTTTTTNSEIWFTKSTDGGSTFGSPKNLSTNPGGSFHPQIAVSGKNVYVVWDDNTTPTGASDILIRRSINSGSTFGSPFNLSTNLGKSVNPQIAASGSTAYVVWEDSSPGPGLSSIFFRKSGAAGTINLSRNMGASFHPQITVSGSNVYVVWDGKSTPSTPTSEIWFRKSTTVGSTFGPAINVSKTLKNSSNPQIAVSGSNVYVVWEDNTTPTGASDIFFNRSTTGGSTFGVAKDISNMRGSSFLPQIAVSGINVYVVWYNFPPIILGKSDVWFTKSTTGGSTFGIPKNLSSNPGDSRFPQIAVSGINVYVVWEDNTSPPTNGNFDILFKKSTTGGSTFGLAKDISNTPKGSFSPRIAVS